MARITVIIGVLMILLGVLGFVLTGSEQKTALIPSYFGILFVLLSGLASAKPQLNKHLMHVSALLALLGMAGTFRALGTFVTLVGGGEVERQAAVIAQTIFFVLAAVYLVLCIRSFIAARRARKAV
jgi:hypothetical protein